MTNNSKQPAGKNMLTEGQEMKLTRVLTNDGIQKGNQKNHYGNERAAVGQEKNPINAAQAEFRPAPGVKIPSQKK